MFKVRRKLAVIAGVLSAVATYAGFSVVSCQNLIGAISGNHGRWQVGEVSGNAGGWQSCGDAIVLSMVIAIPLSLAVGSAVAAFVAMRWKGI